MSSRPPKETPSTDGPLQDDTDQALLEASPDGIVAVDTHGIIRLCNPAAEALFARSADELIGSPFGFPVVIHQTSEIDLIRPDGSVRVVEMRVTATTWHGEHIHVAALRDVTTRKQAEQDLEIALDHQTTVVAVAAHELRAPVAEIKMLVNVIRDRRQAITEEQAVEVIDQIATRLDRLESLMHKLLTASRLDAGDRHVPSHPVAVLETLLERLTEFGGHTQEVSVSCSPELRAYVNRHDLSEMLTAYLENAFAYGSPPVEVRATELADSIDIRVCDHGPGIPYYFVPHLFERFSREPKLAQSTEGSGLGLWIVRNLAHANGGEAWYEPSSDGGTCFCLRLPATPA